MGFPITVTHSSLIEENTSLDLIFGTVYKCEIAELAENGIYVRVRPGTRPVFIPNRNLDTRRVAHASALGFKQGDYVHVQYLGRDDASGQHRFSRKLLQSLNQKQMDLNRK